MDETQGSWDRALVVVLADGAIISACGQHLVTSPPGTYLFFLDGVPAPLRDGCRQSPGFVQYSTAP